MVAQAFLAVLFASSITAGLVVSPAAGLRIPHSHLQQDSAIHVGVETESLASLKLQVAHRELLDVRASEVCCSAQSLCMSLNCVSFNPYHVCFVASGHLFGGKASF